MVAHDLRAPLRHLRQFSDFLTADLGEAATPAALEHLEIIKSSSARMSAMVERLLEYARIGVGAPKLGPVDLASCLAEAVEMLGADARAAQIESTFGAFGWVKGDRVLITRLFQNLVQNAIKFRKPDMAPRIRISAQGDAQSVVIAFEDEGVGVDPSQADAIFEMFGRAQVGPEISGDGIGLAFCKRICETLGGSIALDISRLDGARLLVRLIRARASRKRAKTP